MAGFSIFNQTTTTTTPFATPSLNTTPAFGATPNQQNVSFGTTATPGFESTANASGFGPLKPQFGSPNSSLFGAPNITTTQAGLSFGSNIQASNLTQPQTASTNLNKPAFGTSNFGGTPSTATGLSFGTTPAPSQPGVPFNAPTATPQTGIAFGTPTSAVPSQTGITFGTPTSAAVAPQTGLSFGSQNAALQTGLSFGMPTSTTVQPSPSFGMPTATTTQPLQTGLSFGMPTAITTQPLQTGLSFGMPTSTTAQPSPSFGMPSATTAQTSISFGLPSLTSTAGLTQTLPPALGATAPGTTTKGLSLSFGTANMSQPSPSFGTGSNLSTTSQATPGTLTLGTTTTSAPTLFGGLPSNIPAPASSAPSLFGNLTSAATTSSTLTSGGIFSWQKPATDIGVTGSVSSTSNGLGGVDHSAVTTTQSSMNTMMSVKEQPLPNEIQQTVVAFKEYAKTQKNLGSEVARSSAEPLTKLTQQITALNNLILNLGSVLSQQKFTAEKIKLETIKSLNDYELAQKIKDSPVASEERVLSIRRYFIEKISAFEESTKVLQEKIEYVYQHVSTLPQENSLSAESLKLIVKKLHDSFVVIGARAYKLHNEMQLLKVQYMTLRNQYVKDNSSIPFSLNKELQLPTEARVKSSDLALEGPNPFSKTGNGSFNSLLLTSQNRSFAASTSASSVGGLLNTSKPFGFSDISGLALFDQSTSPGLSSGQQFNLQKPPLGNKRGKR